MIQRKYRPFFKCPGGKSQVLDEIKNHLPDNITFYAELFLGGGAVFLELLNKDCIQEYYLNELNPDIHNLWSTSFSDNFNLLDYNNQYEKEDFYNIRSDFNKNRSLTTTRAKQFLFLNKNCYNGLIRYNQSGGFNSPVGSYKKTQICNLNLIQKINTKVKEKNVVLDNSDFITAFAKKFGTLDDLSDWFFYFDPPYFPKSDTANFREYTKEGFSNNRQDELLMLLNIIDLQGGKFLLSNSFTQNSLDLYSSYDIIEISAPRSINSKAKGRKKIKEILVRNYL